MVSFHEIPYSEVFKRGKIQSKLISSFIEGVLTKKKLFEEIEQKLSPIRWKTHPYYTVTVPKIEDATDYTAHVLVKIIKK